MGYAARMNPSYTKPLDPKPLPASPRGHIHTHILTHVHAHVYVYTRVCVRARERELLHMRIRINAGRIRAGDKWDSPSRGVPTSTPNTLRTPTYIRMFICLCVCVCERAHVLVCMQH